MSADPTEFATTVAAAARATGLHRATLAGWIGAGLVRRTERGIRIREVLEVRKAREEARDRRRQRADPERWLAELRRHGAAKAELDLHRMRGALVPLAWFDSVLADRAHELRRSLQGLARSLPPELVAGLPTEVAHVTAKAMQAVLEREFRALCEGYAHATPEVPLPRHAEDDGDEDLHDEHEGDALPHDDVRDTDFPEVP